MREAEAARQHQGTVITANPRGPTLDTPRQGKQSAARRVLVEAVGWSRRRPFQIIAGAGALAWLLLRSGTKPSRFSYPCQQSALAAATAALGVPLVAAILAGRAGLLSFMRSGMGKLGGGFVALLLIAWFTAASLPDALPMIVLAPPQGYRPEVFHVPYARGVEPGRFGGVDDLVALLGASGFKLHRSAMLAPSSGPDGLIDPDDVVIVKINAQWAQRGGTNTDVLRGVIRAIVEHPDGFAGEVIVADNGQASGSVARLENNAEDTSQSPQDVAVDFAAEGWSVSARLWDSLRYSSVQEYGEGDMGDGYVLAGARDPQTSIIVSYPKFRSAGGAYVSYKYGIWDDLQQVYEADRLVVINIPVLKTHSIYAVTAAVKNHMGVITTGLSTDSHAGVGRGGLGSVLAEVRRPDLTILDCIWILARPGQGPASLYASASRRDELVAGVDPVALDVWAVKHILVPQIQVNGFTPPQYAAQDPDNPNGGFRMYLDRSMSEMLAGGITTTNDYSAVRVHRLVGDIDRDGDRDLIDYVDLPACLAGPDFAVDPTCSTFDGDGDGRIDLTDVAVLQNLFSGP